MADEKGWRESQSKDRIDRLQSGQFFTPLPVSQFLANWLSSKGLNQSEIRLLDPGAGGGVLTAAVVDRICKLRNEGKLGKIRKVSLHAYEHDSDLIPVLTRTLRECVAGVSEVGINSEFVISSENYIEGAVEALSPDLFETSETAPFTHAILNPPYRKLNSQSADRARMSSIGIETSNLYAAFAWLAFRQLDEGGELVAITPRSFCNGPYFREFRKEILEDGEFRRVHVFDARNEAFGRDQVLQENILFHLRKPRKSRSSFVSVSTGSIESPRTARVPVGDFVSPQDSDRVIHIAPEKDAMEVRAVFLDLPNRLEDLGVAVSTGPVVEFRLRKHLHHEVDDSSVALIYPHCVRAGRVSPPRPKAEDYSDSRISKKAVAIEVGAETEKWLVETKRFVLIKRFSSKEEKRRLVAGVLEPADFQSNRVGIENHLNFLHRNRCGLPKDLALGLCRFLNSTIADQFFRQFNGHTQVNASDLRMFRFPGREQLQELGEATVDDSDQQSIDRAMSEILRAPIWRRHYEDSAENELE